MTLQKRLQALERVNSRNDTIARVKAVLVAVREATKSPTEPDERGIIKIPLPSKIQHWRNLT